MLDRVKWPAVGCFACAAALVVVHSLAYRASIQEIDARVLHRLSVGSESAASPFASYFAYLADPLPQVVLLAVLCLAAFHWGRPRDGAIAVGLVVGANVTTQALKAVLSQPRYQPILAPHQIPATGFPSGHSTASMAMAIAYALVVPRSLRPVAVVVGAALVFAIGLSLVVLHWHYPSDVLGGWLVAGGWGCAALAAWRLEHRPLVAGGPA